MADIAAVEAIRVDRAYRTRAGRVDALVQVSLRVEPGEVVAVTGPSGSGKSTLIYLLGGLDDPDTGQVEVTGLEWRSLRADQRSRLLRTTCGFLAQGRTLLPQATAAENVEVPLLLSGVHPAERRVRVAAALARVGLDDEAPKLADQLSGGQQQRVGIARALVTRPSVVLADEPTASLDSATAMAVTDLLVQVATDGGAAVVLVTHDPAVAEHADREVRLLSGRLADNASRS